MADGNEESKSWREQAQIEGYEFATKADMDQMRKDVNDAKDFRASLPDEYRNDPSQFFTDASNAIQANKDRSDTDKSDVEKLQGEITNLKRENTKLTNKLTDSEQEVTKLGNTNHSLEMYGHIGRIQMLRNVVIDDTFIDDVKVQAFDRSGYDISSENGMKEFQNAVWNEILEPASSKQENGVARVSGYRGSPSKDQNGNNENDQRGNEPPIPAWGSGV